MTNTASGTVAPKHQQPRKSKKKNGFTVSFVKNASSSSSNQQVPKLVPRSDIDLTQQRSEVEIEKAKQREANLRNDKLKSSRIAGLELHHLRQLILCAIQHQIEHNSISLCLAVQRATQQTLSAGQFNNDQIEEARAIAESGTPLDLDYIQKNLLLDIELVYLHHGYAAALQCFQRLHPFQTTVKRE